jgi:hypothetical protein
MRTTRRAVSGRRQSSVRNGAAGARATSATSVLWADDAHHSRTRFRGCSSLPREPWNFGCRTKSVCPLRLNLRGEDRLFANIAVKKDRCFWKDRRNSIQTSQCRMSCSELGLELRRPVHGRRRRKRTGHKSPCPLPDCGDRDILALKPTFHNPKAGERNLTTQAPPLGNTPNP